MIAYLLLTATQLEVAFYSNLDPMIPYILLSITINLSLGYLLGVINMELRLANHTVPVGCTS